METSQTETIGRFIRRTRLERGLSLGQLAELVGRSSSSVRRWERDEVAPAPGIVPTLASVLEVPESELIALRSSTTDDGNRDEDTESHDGIGDPVLAPMQEPAEDPPVTGTRVGFFGDLWSSMTSLSLDWRPWARGLGTAAALIVMLIIFVWAVGELFDALGEVWDSIDSA